MRRGLLSWRFCWGGDCGTASKGFLAVRYGDATLAFLKTHGRRSYRDLALVLAFYVVTHFVFRGTSPNRALSIDGGPAATSGTQECAATELACTKPRKRNYRSVSRDGGVSWPVTLRLDRITILGNDVVRAGVVRREAQVADGDPIAVLGRLHAGERETGVGEEAPGGCGALRGVERGGILRLVMRDGAIGIELARLARARFLLRRSCCRWLSRRANGRARSRWETRLRSAAASVIFARIQQGPLRGYGVRRRRRRKRIARAARSAAPWPRAVLLRSPISSPTSRKSSGSTIPSSRITRIHRSRLVRRSAVNQSSRNGHRSRTPMPLVRSSRTCAAMPTAQTANAGQNRQRGGRRGANFLSGGRDRATEDSRDCAAARTAEPARECRTVR